MGRYSSVQSYADNNAAVRTIPYDQATGSAEPKEGKVAVEKVSNPYGSTAGAGSGEFHIYRHARAREMQRWKSIDEQELEMKAEEEFKQSLQQAQTEEQHKTEKRRKKRQREKEARLRKKNLKAAGIDLWKSSATPPTQSSSSATKSCGADNDKDEFDYTSLVEQQKAEEVAKAKEAEAEEASGDDKMPADGSKDEPVEEIPNDGTFLEMMKKRLAEEAVLNKPEQAKKTDRENDDEADAISEPPPRKKRILETRIIDEDDEGPILPPSFR